jgi:hypothetical protein
MNVYDAERMGDLAAEAGYREALRVEDADLIVLNTCHIRERASEKIFSELGKLRELKEERAREGRRREAKSCAANRPSMLSLVRRAIIACRSSCARLASVPASWTLNFRRTTNSLSCRRRRPTRFVGVALPPS